MSILLDDELVLYGFVGDNYWDAGFTSVEVLQALTELGRDADITVRINSGGGYVDDGIAIFNALKAHKGKVTVIVDAMAASSASIIAMAGDERIMRTGAMMMIHEPSSSIWGTAADIEQFAKVVEKQAENLASIYAEVTGSEITDIRADMKSELWMTADEAVERGFATSLETQKAKTAAAHDYRVYAHAPARLVALSERKNWTSAKAVASADRAPASGRSGHEKEKTEMTNEPNSAAQNSAETSRLVAEAVAKAMADSKARIKAITASEEAKGREELADYLAHDTDLTAEVVVAMLAKSPKAVAVKPSAGASYEQQRVTAAALAMPGTSGQQESGLRAAVSARIAAIKPSN